MLCENDQIKLNSVFITALMEANQRGAPIRQQIGELSHYLRGQPFVGSKWDIQECLVSFSTDSTLHTGDGSLQSSNSSAG